MHSIATDILQRALEHHRAGEFEKALPAYNALLNREFDNDQLLYLIGDCFVRQGFNGLAATLFHTALTINPKNQPAWIDLGVAFKHEHMNDHARVAWERALELGENIEILSNMATLYADTGAPQKALEWLDKALQIEPDHQESRWNSALALLSLRNWPAGWDAYEYRANLVSWDNRVKTGLPVWDGKTPGTVYFHGEQGTGDEIMFLSCVPDAIALGVTPVFEVNIKLAPLVKATWPDAVVVATEDEFLASGVKADFKCGLGSLGKFFRQKNDDFPGTPYLKPDPARVKFYREQLEALGPGPYIGIAWVGGVKATRIHERSLPVVNFTPIRSLGTCVSLQYGPHKTETEAAKLPILGAASTGEDLGEQAALIAALDRVVTVVQTVVHLCGAVGTPAEVLVPAHSSWRYGVSGSKIPWYKCVNLYRQQEGQSFGPTIAHIYNVVKNAYFGFVPETERKAA